MGRKKVSCVISAHNEEESIKEVIESIITNELIAEIVVVDDASSDKTSDIIKSFKSIKIIQHKTNLGKSAAIKSGLLLVKNELVLLLDGDIPNITDKNISSIISPILNNKCDVSIALIGNVIQRLFRVDILSGIRCAKKTHLINFINQYNPVGYNFEILFNQYIFKNKLSFCFVDWTNSSFRYSTVKYGKLKGIKRILSKRISIYKRIGLMNFYIQYLKMLNQKLDIGD